MTRRDSHVPDEELVLLLDGELDGRRAAAAARHDAHCSACQARRDEFQRAGADIVRAYRAEPESQVPAGDGPAASLRAQMERQAARPRIPSWRLPTLASAAILAVTAGVSALIWISGQRGPGALPDSRLTPGATRLVSRDQICTAAPEQDDGRAVPVELAHRVFHEYRIGSPRPGAFEVDFLISPALGGADDIRNLWPQPYSGGAWNSRIKDALEDHLRRLVCDGRVDLATAQREIARDWIAAYRKYFRTDRPLAAHALFIKDRPWQ